MVHAAKVPLWLEYDSSDEESDPTLSPLITKRPWKRLWYQKRKKMESAHLAGFGECNISITDVCTELRREVEKTPLIDVTLYEKILTAEPTFLIGFSSVSSLFSPSFIRSTLSPPRWKSNKSADIDPVSLAGLISFQPERDDYLHRSWQTIVFTIFFSQANKGGAVIASDYMKNRLMIPIYNSRLNNDTVKSWQAMINEGSYKTYLVWRLAGDELHSDTNSW